MRLPPLPVGNPAELVEAWLLRFPADFWYRQRYTLPLFGPQHRATDLRSVRAEFEQENLLRRLRAEPATKPDAAATPDQLAQRPLLRPATGAGAAPLPNASAAQIEAEFDALDLDQFNDEASAAEAEPET